MLWYYIKYEKIVNNFVTDCTHSIKKSAFHHLKWLRYSRKTEISNNKKGKNCVIIHDESTF